MPEGWQIAALGDIAVDAGLVGGPFGSSLGRKDYVENGVPVIRGANIAGQGKFDDSDLVFVTEQKVESELRRNLAVPGDIILTQRGTLGQVGVVPQDSYPVWVISQSQERLRVDQAKADRDFVYFVLRSPALTDEIRRRAITTGVPHINLGITQELPIPLPPLDEQKRIAWLLGALDDKIENNQRLAKTLEEIATALFRAWFVEFTGHDDLVEGEIGLVPRGWSIGGLSEVATVTMGQSPPSSTYTPDSAAGVLMVQGKGAFGQRFPKREVFSMEPRRLADAGDLLMTVRAPVGDLNVCTEETCLGRGVAGISSPNPGFVEFALRAGASRWRAHESGTIYSAVNKQQVEGFPVVIPPSTVLEQFELIVAPMRDKIALCHQEIKSLSELRDQLLPRLLCGSLHVDRKYGDAP